MLLTFSRFFREKKEFFLKHPKEMYAPMGIFKMLIMLLLEVSKLRLEIFLSSLTSIDLLEEALKSLLSRRKIIARNNYIDD